MEKAFVYKWVHLPTLKWYIGFHNGKSRNYVCSSKLVKAHILKNPNEWNRDIIQYGSELEMFQLESLILQILDAKNDPRSFNGHNNDGEKFNTIGRTKEFMSAEEIHNRKTAAKLRGWVSGLLLRFSNNSKQSSLCANTFSLLDNASKSNRSLGFGKTTVLRMRVRSDFESWWRVPMSHFPSSKSAIASEGGTRNFLRKSSRLEANESSRITSMSEGSA